MFIKYIFIYSIFIVSVLYILANIHDLNEKNSFNDTIRTEYIKAKEGDLEAQLRLARAYSRGGGTVLTSRFGQDLHSSGYWYEQAALKGDALAQLEIGKIYHNGIGIPKNLEYANYWYNQAALQNNAEAQYLLAKNFEEGNGISQDFNSAMHWYLKSSENGYAEAIFRVGIIYDDGLLGVEENNEIALSYFERLDPHNYSLKDLSTRIILIKNPVEFTNKVNTNHDNPNTSPSSQGSKYHGTSTNPTAECRDGTYSYSLGRQGVCSHHGGVKYWF